MNLVIVNAEIILGFSAAFERVVGLALYSPFHANPSGSLVFTPQ